MHGMIAPFLRPSCVTSGKDYAPIAGGVIIPKGVGNNPILLAIAIFIVAIVQDTNGGRPGTLPCSAKNGSIGINSTLSAGVVSLIGVRCKA